MKGKNNKKRGRSNSRQYSRRDSDAKRQESESTESAGRTPKYDCRSTPNDPAWYARDPQVIRDFASLPFGNPLGAKLPNDVASIGSSSISGIMTLNYGPAIGVADSENSAVNVAMRNIYSYVRHANSGHSNYDAPDLMLYLLAMDSIYMFIAWMKRLYGQMMLTTVYNRYYPKALLESERVDYDDLQANISDFRGFINLYIAKVGSLAVPNSMSYMARHTWMTEGLYVDDPTTPKAQTYKYVPGAFFKFALYEDPDSGLTRGILQQTGQIYDAAGQLVRLRTLQDIMNLGNELINPILANEDMNIMSGDILKAFTDAGIVKLTGITENYIVLPTFSQEVLSQMENASVFSGGYGIAIDQKTEVGTGYLVSEPIVSVHNILNLNQDISGAFQKEISGNDIQQMVECYQGTRLLNMHIQDVPADAVMVATRLLATVSTDSSLTGSAIGGRLLARAKLSSCGSEIVIGAHMWSYTYTNQGAKLIDSQFATSQLYTAVIPEQVPTLGTSVFQIALMVLPTLAQLTQYNCYPMVYPTFVCWDQDQAISGIAQASCVFGDIANYTTVSEDNIQNMNDIALLSEFSVPQAGLFR